MNLVQAIKLMIAARENPVLAAWTSMMLEVEVAPRPEDVSPYDAWDAYQQLYAHGLVSETEFASLDPQQVFFRSKPTWDDVSRVFNNLITQGILGNTEPPPMSSKSRVPVDPFGQNNTALAERGEKATAIPASRTTGLPGMPFGSSPAPPPLNPFGNREVLPPDRQPAPRLDGLGVPRGTLRGGLPCNDPAPKGVADVGGMQMEAEVYCCGTRLEMTVDGGQVIGPDDLPSGQISVIDAIFHGRCAHCQAVWHCSVGKMVSQESFR